MLSGLLLSCRNLHERYLQADRNAVVWFMISSSGLAIAGIDDRRYYSFLVSGIALFYCAEILLKLSLLSQFISLTL